MDKISSRSDCNHHLSFFFSSVFIESVSSVRRHSIVSHLDGHLLRQWTSTIILNDIHTCIETNALRAPGPSVKINVIGKICPNKILCHITISIFPLLISFHSVDDERKSKLISTFWFYVRKQVTGNVFANSIPVVEILLHSQHQL